MKRTLHSEGSRSSGGFKWDQWWRSWQGTTPLTPQRVRLSVLTIRRQSFKSELLRNLTKTKKREDLEKRFYLLKSLSPDTQYDYCTIHLLNYYMGKVIICLFGILAYYGFKINYLQPKSATFLSQKWDRYSKSYNLSQNIDTYYFRFERALNNSLSNQSIYCHTWAIIFKPL